MQWSFSVEVMQSRWNITKKGHISTLLVKICRIKLQTIYQKSFSPPKIIIKRRLNSYTALWQVWMQRIANDEVSPRMFKGIKKSPHKSKNQVLRAPHGPWGSECIMSGWWGTVSQHSLSGFVKNLFFFFGKINFPLFSLLYIFFLSQSVHN